MPFSNSVVQEKFQRVGGRCECVRTNCSHPGNPDRCTRKFSFSDRDTADGRGWQANHKISQASGGSDGIANCEILCIPCHKNTRSFGRS